MNHIKWNVGQNKFVSSRLKLVAKWFRDQCNQKNLIIEHWTLGHVNTWHHGMGLISLTTKSTIYMYFSGADLNVFIIRCVNIGEPVFNENYFFKSITSLNQQFTYMVMAPFQPFRTILYWSSTWHVSQYIHSHLHLLPAGTSTADSDSA